ncbi:hypothetical protein [Streptomyces sp. NPDC048638]|uniref:hypothetical protein n=1 Tax=Streptomyces sp. NPDC048638 TaxID=3365580 RepID=UPI003710F0AF
MEFLLLTNATHLDAAVSAGQRFWTLVLWNPWFIVGGLAFGLSALEARRRDHATSPQTGHPSSRSVPDPRTKASAT